MASKRTTNNSSVSTLEDQNRVLTQVLSTGEGSSTLSRPTPIDKGKSLPKKKGIKAKSSSGKTSGDRDARPLDVRPLDWEPAL